MNKKFPKRNSVAFTQVQRREYLYQLLIILIPLSNNLTGYDPLAPTLDALRDHRPATTNHLPMFFTHHLRHETSFHETVVLEFDLSRAWWIAGARRSHGHWPFRLYPDPSFHDRGHPADAECSRTDRICEFSRLPDRRSYWCISFFGRNTQNLVPCRARAPVP